MSVGEGPRNPVRGMGSVSQACRKSSTGISLHSQKKNIQFLFHTSTFVCKLKAFLMVLTLVILGMLSIICSEFYVTQYLTAKC